MPLSPSPTKPWALVPLRGGLGKTPIPIPEGDFRVGREGGGNNVELHDAQASRKHALFQMGRDGLQVRDLGSRNGVKINGVARRQANLAEGDRVEIGEHLFEVALHVGSPPANLPAALESPTQSPTIRSKPSSLKPRTERHLQLLFQLCYWMTDGRDEQTLLGPGLQNIVAAFEVAEVHCYSAKSDLVAFATAEGDKPKGKLAAYLADRLGSHPQVAIIHGDEIAGHQRRSGDFNYLVGPLRLPGDAAGPAPWIVLLRPTGWTDFTADDRTLLEAVCQLWVRCTQRTRAFQQLQRENTQLKARLPATSLLGTSAVMQQLRERAAKVAAMKTPVLIQGETGSGKEVLAQFIHDHSPRAGKPYLRVNCAGITESLVESTLFGYLKGAFTGADKDTPGKFQLAEGGTLFLDEIGELSLAAQAKLLRVLENGEVEPVGPSQPVKVDVRVVAATHRDLDEMVRSKQFREDLLYRLKVLRLRMPPLREHPEDIPLLARHFLARTCETNGLAELQLNPEALERLVGAPWKGNARELRNLIETCATMAAGPIITGADVADALAS